jgi:hypothetical protein
MAIHEQATGDFAARGIMLRKVPVDVRELEKWCRDRKKSISIRLGGRNWGLSPFLLSS